MKKIVPCLTVLFYSSYCLAQTFALSINEGYGSGIYTAGDTVHIWSNLDPNKEVFDRWTGDIATVEATQEWHTTIIMPNNNVTITAKVDSVGPLALNMTQINGLNHSKKVFYYFDANPVGTILFFHGGSGSAQEVVDRIESAYFLMEAKHRHYNIIMTESEDRTLGDPDSDGNTRWILNNWDINLNVDIANCSLIIDSFANAGMLDLNVPIHSVGVSNGGNFAHMVSYALNFCSTSMFCSHGGNSSNLFTITSVPAIFNIGDNDPNAGGSNTGPYANYNTLLNRGISTDLNHLYAAPLYPERFMRIDGINASLSANLFYEFLNNNLLDSQYYFTVYATNFMLAITSNSSNYPVFASLNITLREHVIDQVVAVMADHSMFTEYNNAIFEFMDQNGASMSGLTETNELQNKMIVYPNPTANTFCVEERTADAVVSIYTNSGCFLHQSVGVEPIDLSVYPDGLYIVHILSKTVNLSQIIQKISTK